MEDSNVFTHLTNIRDRHSIYHTQLNKNLKKLTPGTASTSTGTAANDKPSSDGPEETEGVNKLSEDLEQVHQLVTHARERFKQQQSLISLAREFDSVGRDGGPPPLEESSGIAVNSRPGSSAFPITIPKPLTPSKTPSEIYREALRPLQFLSYKMIKDSSSVGSGSGKSVLQFALPFHFVTEARMLADTLNTKRAKRLAQEAVSLSSALPLDYSSSVFIRYDEDRLDIMKVLITGPSDTPYMNGCFVFDIFFPNDYPNTPLLCNFTTTGNGTVRFNPNLYNDGKVCLSILNTWHGRPEEKWNAQTSNLLQVLVSIQSLILVSEPYFNEPGYERSRNTPAGQENSEEYSANIKQATVKWAILNQLKQPTPCFKDVIHAHFYLKKDEVLEQVQGWLSNIETLDINKRYAKKLSNHVQSLKKSLNDLKAEMKKLSPPAGLGSEETGDAIGISKGAPSVSKMTDVADSVGRPGSSKQQPSSSAAAGGKKSQLAKDIDWNTNPRVDLGEKSIVDSQIDTEILSLFDDYEDPDIMNSFSLPDVEVPNGPPNYITDNSVGPGQNVPGKNSDNITAPTNKTDSGVADVGETATQIHAKNLVDSMIDKVFHSSPQVSSSAGAVCGHTSEAPPPYSRIDPDVAPSGSASEMLSRFLDDAGHDESGGAAVVDSGDRSEVVADQEGMDIGSDTTDGVSQPTAHNHKKSGAVNLGTVSEEHGEEGCPVATASGTPDAHLPENHEDSML